MVKEFAVSVSDFGFVFLCMNVVLFLFRYKRIPSPVKYFGFYLMLNLFTEVVSKWMFRLGIENLYLLHIYTLFEFITWSIFFRYVFIQHRSFQKMLPWLIGTISILIIGNTIFLEPLSGFNSNAKTLVQITLIAYVIFYFFNAFGKTDLTKPVERSLSLINFAVLLYYSGSLFIFMFSKLLTDMDVFVRQQHAFWAINALLNLIFQILIFFSLWTIAFRKTKS